MAHCDNPKRKSVCVTLEEQAAVAWKLLLETGASTLIKTFEVFRKTVFNIKKRASDILKMTTDSTTRSTQKTSRVIMFPQIKNKIIDLVIVCRTQKLPMTISVLQQHALLWRESMLTQSTLSEKDREQFINCPTSNGWIIGFVKRFDLRAVRLSKEAGSVDALYLAKDMIALRKQLKTYDISCIFNIGETGLFYKLISRQTYISQHEARQSIRGTNAMKEKDRITRYVCTGGTGVRVPMCIIGNTKSFRCFRIEQPPVPYFGQCDAGSDTKTFKE